VERSVLELVSHLDPVRFQSEVWYMTGGGELAGRFTARGITVRRVPLFFARDLSIVPRLTFLLRHHRADILHTHHPEASGFGRLAAPSAHLKAVIATEHSVVHWSDPGRFANRLVRATADRADYVACVSRAVEYLARGAGAALPEKSGVIHDGVSDRTAASEPPAERRAAARRRFGLPDKGPMVGALGELAPHKGIRTMIEMAPLILSERADAWFVVAGDGPERPRLERQVCELKVEDRFFFTGSALDPHELLPALDVLVIPSLTEGYGIGALEAMSHGVPVVGTHVGGLPEILETGKGGLMVAPNAPHEMAAVVLYFLSSALFSAETGGAGIRFVAEQGSARRMADEYARVYERSVAEGNP
jgi:glycosyltransferase involved in cell wall biosynthesis